MMNNINPRVLCVDDEPEVLEGIKQNLRRSFNLHLATDPAQALAKMKDKKFAVIVSDMRMPAMNGAEFLQRSRETNPDATRILLTGQCDINTAISAVNDGQIFRFLNKPCSSKDLKSVLDLAIKQHQLISAEKELLQKTLKGSVKLLTDALAITSPLAFSCAKRVHKRVAQVSSVLALNDTWDLEIASLLSQLGTISLNDETLKKMYYGTDLNSEELVAIQKVDALTKRLLGNIPRLDAVVSLLEEVQSMHQGGTASKSLPAQILYFALQLDKLENRGVQTSLAINTVHSEDIAWNADMVKVFMEHIGSGGVPETIKELPLAAIQEGMILAQDLYTTAGALLVGRGFEVTEGFAAKLRSFKKDYVKEPIQLIVPGT